MKNGCEGQDAVMVEVSESPEVSISGLPQFCEGDSTTLDAGTFVSYEWSTGEMTQTIDVDAADTYDVTVSNENGCTGTASVEVASLVSPTVEIEGASGVCPGDSTLLTVP